MSTCKAKTMEAFHHTPLSIPNSIRLISLLPSQGLQNPLELTLSTICLDEATNKEHSYEALSYVWGARNGSRPTECMGKVLPVTPNCESALRHLRLKNKARTLWIDAICIDQEVNVESTEERNVQVELMGKIYQKAFRTLCWLGEANDYTAELMAHLSRIGNCPSQRGLKRFLLFDGTCKYGSEQTLNSTPNRKITPRRDHRFRLFLAEPSHVAPVAFPHLDCSGSGIFSGLPRRVRKFDNHLGKLCHSNKIPRL